MAAAIEKKWLETCRVLGVETVKFMRLVKLVKSVSGAFIFSIILTTNSSAESYTVRDVQRWLTQLGYNPGPIDGSYGSKAANALTAFYASQGQQFDGILDQNEIDDLLKVQQSALEFNLGGIKKVQQSALAPNQINNSNSYPDLKNIALDKPFSIQSYEDFIESIIACQIGDQPCNLIEFYYGNYEYVFVHLGANMIYFDHKKQSDFDAFPISWEVVGSELVILVHGDDWATREKWRKEMRINANEWSDNNSYDDMKLPDFNIPSSWAFFDGIKNADERRGTVFKKLVKASNAEEQRIADEKAAEERRIAEREQRIADEKAAQERRIAEEMAAEEQRIAELRAAEQGDADAQFNLGLRYYDQAQNKVLASAGNNDDFVQDTAEAIKWYRLAAEQGNEAAQFNLGEIYFNGVGTIEDHAEAAHWYRLAAEQGNVDAQFIIAEMYYYGDGIEQNDTEAAKWYRLPAEQGNASAQGTLGTMYEMGIGVTQDYAEAIKWYRLAAEQGGLEAQLRLGLIYENGWAGVSQDGAEAIHWYRLASKQGSTEAQQNLDLLFINAQKEGEVENQKRIKKQATEKEEFCKNIQLPNLWTRFDFLTERPITLLGLDMSLNKSERVNTLECKGYKCRDETNFLGIKQTICRQGNSEVTINESQVTFDCNSFEVCGRDINEVAEILISTGKVAYLEPDYWQDIDGNQHLKYCGRGNAGDMLCVREFAWLTPMIFVDLIKGNLGKPQPKFD